MGGNVVIIGAGPAGIAAAKTLVDKGFSGDIHLIERGRLLRKRICPVDRGHKCSGCGGTCNVLSGFGGGIHYGDAVKLSQLPAGRRLQDTLGPQAETRIHHAIQLIEETLGTSIPFCTPAPEDNLEEGYTFKPYPVAVLPAVQVRRFLEQIYEWLEAVPNVSIHMNTCVEHLDKLDNGRYYVETSSSHGDQENFIADQVIVAVGRAGLFWWRDTIRSLGLAFRHPQPSIGLRFELNHKWLLPAGFLHPDYKVSMQQPVGKFKSFCYCGGTSGGRIKYTKYDDFCLLDGHVESAEDHPPSPETAGNFALLHQVSVSNPHTDPMLFLRRRYIEPYKAFRPDNPGLPVAQRFGDFRRRQAGPQTWDELRASLLHIPTVNDLVPAPIDTLFEDDVHAGFCQSLERYMGAILREVKEVPPDLLDNILVIALELEGLWDTMEVDPHLETSSPGLFVVGDAAGIAQGILQAMAAGIAAALRIADGNNSHIKQSVRDRLIYDRYWSNKDYLVPSDTFVDMVHRIKHTKLDGIIADLGCGIGRHALYALSEDLRVVAIDHSSRAISKLRNRVNGEETLSLIEGDFPHWLAEAAENSLDGIVCFDAIHHISSDELVIQQVLADMVHCLRPGGYLLLSLLADIDYGVGGAPDGRFLVTVSEAEQFLAQFFTNARVLKQKRTAVRFDKTVNLDAHTTNIITTHYQATRLLYLYQIIKDH